MNSELKQTGLRRVPIEQLRDDVHFLGSVLGSVLSEQHGEALLELVEDIRLSAIFPAHDHRHRGAAAPR